MATTAFVVGLRTIRSLGNELVTAAKDIVEALGGFNAMAGEVPTYVPLEEFIENQIIEGAASDFDHKDLIFENEFVKEVI